MIEEDFKTIVEAFKENLFYYEKLPTPKDNFPAVNFFVKQMIEQYDRGVANARIIFEARIFAPWPATCKKFEEVLLYTKDDLYEYRKILRTFIRYLSVKFKYGVDDNERFVYKVFPYQVTEHNYIAISVTGAVYENSLIDCCEDDRFDQTVFDDTNAKSWASS